MTTLPPLPLVDGYMFIDNSKVETLITCPRATEYNVLHAKRAVGDRPALNFGSGIHAALEARYKGSADTIDGPTEQAMFDALTRHFNEHPQPDDEYRTLDLATKLIQFYNQKYNYEPFEVARMEDGRPCVEMPFALPLTDDQGDPCIFIVGDQLVKVMYTGKIDLIIRVNGQIQTLDHKTAYMFGSGFWQEQQMSAQHLGYCHAVDTLLGVNTTGYRVNAIRTRKPGKTNPDPINEDFERNIYYITPERKQEWRRNLIALLEEFFWNYSRGYLPMKTKWCVGKYGPCQFFDVCSLPEPQRLATLESGLYIDEVWSPLNALQTNKTPQT